MLEKGTVFIGNTDHIPVKEYQEATFSVLATGVQIGNNKSMFSIFNGDGSAILKLHTIKLINVATSSISGINAEFQFNRILSHVSGTDLNMFSFDTADSLEVGITAKTGATISGSTGPLLRYFWNSDEYTQSAGDVNHADHTMMNIIPTYYKPNSTKAIALRAGEGLSITQVMNSTAGFFDIELIFSQEYQAY